MKKAENQAANRAPSSENRLGTMPPGRLLISMSVPMMISFFIQALYNIVDSMFVARISENALTAVSLAFPMQQIMTAIAVGLGVGVNACIPRYLGQGNRARASRTTGNALILNLTFVLIFAVLGITAPGAIYRVQTDIDDIVSMGSAYLSVCWIFCIGGFLGQMFEKLLVSSGKSTWAMLAQASGAIFNIVFDPLLIFGIGPFPELGIRGAAIATVGGQIFAAAIAVILNLRLNRSVEFGIKYLKPDLTAIKDLFGVGFPSMVTMGLSSVTTFCINQILLGYSTTATAVYGIWMKLQNFCYMPIFGMNNGMVPILSYNAARHSEERVNKTIRLAVTGCGIYLLLLTLVLELIPGTILSLFSASDNMLGIGITALRICVSSLVFGGSCVIITTCMQAMEHARFSLIVNLLRQFAVIICAFALLSALTHNLSLTWFAVPLTEIVSLTVSLIFFRLMVKSRPRAE